MRRKIVHRAKRPIQTVQPNVDTLIVIATNNGMDYLPKLLESMPLNYNWIVVDTGSTDRKFKEYLKTLGGQVYYTDGGWCIGAYLWAIENKPAQSYFFMHDSMVIKDQKFLDKFKQYDFCGWLNFHMSFDGPEQESYIKHLYGENVPDNGVFGPIFYATSQALSRVEIPLPATADQAHGMERGIACAFVNAGLNLAFIEKYDTDKMDKDEYDTFTKLRPKRA